MGQFAVFEDGVGFAVKGVIFDAGFITGYADFEYAIGKFGSRGDFLAVGDELGGVDFAVFYGFGACRDGGLVAVFFGGRCIDDVNGRCSDFFPLAAFFNEGGDDLLFVFVAQGQAAFGLVGIGDFEGDDVVETLVDGFSIFVRGRDVGIVRIGRIFFVRRDVGNDVFVGIFIRISRIISLRVYGSRICRYSGVPFIKDLALIRSVLSVQCDGFQFGDFRF